MNQKEKERERERRHSLSSVTRFTNSMEQSTPPNKSPRDQEPFGRTGLERVRLSDDERASERARAQPRKRQSPPMARGFPIISILSSRWWLVYTFIKGICTDVVDVVEAAAAAARQSKAHPTSSCHSLRINRVSIVPSFSLFFYDLFCLSFVRTGASSYS